ncbi:Protein P [Labeo rohita]|uniref:Protein P n=1 Tax=Labeo rohita TaxID=84645 RepID=A0ABQ8MMU1_LABRO|nr:Protein P [Labeo rohita]
MGGAASRCCPRPYERTGVVTERREKCAFSITENHLSRRGVGSTMMQACLFPARIESSSQQSRDGVSRPRGVLPEGKPALHDQGHTAMPTCLGHVEETLVLVSGPGAGSFLSPRMLASGHEWPPRPWSVERSPSSLALQLPGDAGRVSGPLRAGPTGEGRGPPHSSVPVSPLCPREISLPTLPVLQGAAVSSEPTPQSSARKRSGVGELAAPAGVSIAASSAVSYPSSVTGHRTNSSNNTRGQSRETGSLSRFFGSVETTAKCICLGPAHCRARLSHSIWRSATTFQRGLHCGEPRAGSGNGTRSRTLLRKEAIEVVPPHDRESGFYSRYFVVPKKDGEQGVPEVCFHRRSLPVSGSSVQPCTLPPHLKELGLRLNAKKSVLSPLQRTTYLGVVWDSTTMQARLSPARIESILTAVTRVKEGRHSLCVQRDTFWPAVHETPTVVAQDQGVSPRGHPFCMIKVTRQCLRALDMWEKPWFLSQGPVLGAPCRRVTLAADASLTGWGAVMSGHPARGLWSSRHLTWHINCLEMLAVFRALKHFLPDLICHGSLRQHSSGLSHLPPGRSAFAPLIQAGAPDPCVVPGQTPHAESGSCSWVSQYGSRHPVEAGAQARGMDASP